MCLAGLLSILIWIIVTVVIVAIAKAILAYAAVPSLVTQIMNIVLWAVVAIACIYVVIDFLSCVVPLHFPR